jgi:hypothetical protein
MSQSGTLYKWLDGHCLLLNEGKYILTNKEQSFKIYYLDRACLELAIDWGLLQGRIEKFNEGMN